VKDKQVAFSENGNRWLVGRSEVVVIHFCVSFHFVRVLGCSVAGPGSS